MGGTSSSNNKTDQDFVKNTILNVFSTTNLTTNIENTISSSANCSSSSTNKQTIKSVGTGQGSVANFSGSTFTQNASVNIDCIAKEEIFNKLLSSITNDLMVQFNSITDTTIKNSIANQVKASALGGQAESNTNSDISNTENNITNIKNNISSLVNNMTSITRAQNCVAEINNTQSIDIEKQQFSLGLNMNWTQSSTALATCLFDNKQINNIANEVQNAVTADIKATTKTASDNQQTSTTTSANFIDNIGEVISNLFSSGYFLIIVIIIVCLIGIYIFFKYSSSGKTQTTAQSNIKTGGAILTSEYI